MQKASSAERVEIVVEALENEYNTYCTLFPQHHPRVASILDQSPVKQQQLSYQAYCQSWKIWLLSILYNEYATCCICYEDNIPVADMLCNGCGHFTCKICAKRFYQSQIDEGKIEFHCISIDCKHDVNFSQLKDIIDAEHGWILRKHAILKKILDLPAPLRVNCNTPGCDGMMIKKGDEDFIQLCPVCIYEGKDAAYCFKCQEYHNLDAHRQLKTIMKKWFRKSFGQYWPWSSPLPERIAAKAGLKTKKCPHCQTSVAKDDLCNHVTCLVCGIEFNWAEERAWEGYEEEYRRKAVWSGSRK